MGEALDCGLGSALFVLARLLLGLGVKDVHSTHLPIVRTSREQWHTGVQS
jgi:hypothetical protein